MRAVAQAVRTKHEKRAALLGHGADFLRDVFHELFCRIEAHFANTAAGNNNAFSAVRNARRMSTNTSILCR